MKSIKTSVDDAESRDSSLRSQQQCESGSSLVQSSGSVLADAPEYLVRKAASAAGVWGRVKEMPNGCWEWQGATNGQGYGYVSVGRRTRPVHRLVCEIFNGPLKLSENACHSCNNPLCCNPKHLAGGSDMDNSHEYRESQGNGRPRKLNKEEIDEACALYATGKWTLGALGSRFNMTGSGIRKWLTGVKRPSVEALDATEPLTPLIREMYSAGGWTIARLSDHLNAPPGLVKRIAKQVGRADRKQVIGGKRPGRLHAK